MYNWSTDEKELQKSPEAHAIWKLEQLINYGLGGERIKTADLRQYWNQIHIDPARRRFLALLLHG